VTKADLIEKMAKDAGISKVAAKTALESFIDGVTKGLKKRNSRVTLVGFGTFKKVYRKTRMGRNPQTGEKIKIKGRNAVTFKAGKNLI
jgi:DNA-binding protein HU-beta